MTKCLFHNHSLFPPASKFAIIPNMIAVALKTKLMTIIDSGPILLMQTINLRVLPYFLNSTQPDNHGPCCRINLHVNRSIFFFHFVSIFFSFYQNPRKPQGITGCLAYTPPTYRWLIPSPNRGMSEVTTSTSRKCFPTPSGTSWHPGVKRSFYLTASIKI